MISVALTTYNGESYLKIMIDSLLKQTLLPDEIVVCDDCSTDRTWQILSEYKKRDSRFRIFQNEKNLGFKKNFEKAISLCKGEFIALADQDDIWEAFHIQKLLDLIGNADIACGNAKLIDDFGNEKGLLSQAERLDVVYEKDLMLCRILAFTNPFQCASMLIRSSFFKSENSVLPIPDGIAFHDAWFSTCAFLNNGLNYTFDVITLYRQHGDNSSGEKKFWNIPKSVAEALSLVIKKRPKYESDRFAYISEINKRFSLTERQKEIINGSLSLHKLKRKELLFGEKIKCLKWFWRNYRYIFTCRNNQYRLIRTIKLFFRR